MVFLDSATRLVALAQTDKAEAKKALSDFTKQFSALETAMEEASDQIDARSEQGSDWVSIDIILDILHGLFGTAVLLMGLIFYLFRKTVSRPLLMLARDMAALASGRTDIECKVIGRKDEIGSMAAAVEVFLQAAIANEQLEADAELARRQAESDRRAAQENAEADAAERLRVATSGLATGLKRLSAGDLSWQLNEAFSRDFEPLRHDFNTSVKQLRDTLRAISDSISTINNGSREIACDANDLSRRTEQQAASLEQTAAALNEITINVSNSTRRTVDSQFDAATANEDASRSSKVVAQAEDAMQRIENSSVQISYIIGVIDEIAFQTNLLALNAGVEAARAGEAGKGFGGAGSA